MKTEEEERKTQGKGSSNYIISTYNTNWIATSGTALKCKKKKSVTTLLPGIISTGMIIHFSLAEQNSLVTAQQS